MREANKKKRHLPLQRLFAKIPTVLSRLKPCLMMSPLAVSTNIVTKEIRFDVVILEMLPQFRVVELWSENVLLENRSWPK